MDNIEDFYPLSPLQEGMLFHTLYAPGTGVYVNHLSCALTGRLDVAAFERAWRRVIEQHAALRTFFVWKNVKSPVQAVRRSVELPFEQQDWRGLAAAEQEERFESFKQADRARGFELSQPPLMRLALIRLGEDEYQFVWSYHHLLFDGWSIPLIFKDLMTCYRAYSAGQEADLKPSRPFREYIMWLRRRDMSKAEAFWRQTLKGFNALTPLPLDRLAGELPEGAKTHDKQQLRLSAELSASLQLFARQHQLTLNTLLQAAWALLLSRYSGEEEVVYGAVVSGRPSELQGVETMVGAFINTLPMRVRVAPDAPLLPWLKELQQQQLAMIEYEYSPLQQVQGWSDLPRGLPLFESGFAFENYPMDAVAGGTAAPASRQELTVSNMRTAQQANIPLNVLAMPGPRVGIHILHDCGRYEAATVERLLGNLESILEGIASRPAQKLSSISLLNQAQRRRTLTEWNQTLDASVGRRCLHRLFEEQARERPEAVALVMEDERLTYGELNARANQLAHALRRRGVGPEARVGILLERSLEMVVGILGVLKAGGAYVPLDPEYPAPRLSMMMEDAEVSLLLTQEKLRARAEASGAEALCLDAGWGQFAEEGAEDLEGGAEADNLAYIIFTSGSTGRPKGVLVSHGGVNNLARAQIRTFDVRPDSRVFQFASLSFDASVSEIAMTLTTGATLHLGARENLFGQPLADLLRRHAVTHVTIPPSVLAALPPAELPALKTIVVAGEACSGELVKKWAAGRRFVNAYGPTETTVCATMGECLDDRLKPSIGRPMTNTQVYLLDAQLQPVPAGAVAELHVAGVGLARGYMNRPADTAEKFIPNPFSDEPGGRLYKTGDLARHLPDGEIEYCGRIDHQVKVRGFRVEPGEVETILRQHPEVSDAVVTARAEGLAAYLVPRDGATPSLGELRKFMQERLPQHLIPTAFVALAELPLTPNGKVNRGALPDPQAARLEPENVHVEPRTGVERKLAAIWREVLQLERVGVNDHFFDLGGHSLLMIQIHNKAQEFLGREVPLVKFFEFPTIAEIAVFLTAEEPSAQTFDDAYDRASKQKENLLRKRELMRQRASG